MLYFSSDHHFDHKNIIKYCDRPFASIEEMNKTLITYWNETVTPEDEVYYLGDFSLSTKAAENYTKRLNGKKYLIPGNHDRCHSSNFKLDSPGDYWKEHEKKYKCIKKYEDWGWKISSESYSFTLPRSGVKVKLCHFPYEQLDSKDLSKDKDRYDQYRPYNWDKDISKSTLHPWKNWLLCGHVHKQWKTLDKMINVGVDVWNYRPVSEIEIINIIRSRFE